MELVDVSTFFDRVVAADPATGSELFRCQLMAYDESRRDSYSAHRRVISVSPDVTIPTSKAIQIYGEVWVVGSAHSDGWESRHRVKFALHKASGQAKIHRLAGFLSQTPTQTTYGDFQWVADRKELEVSSDTPQKFVAILPEGVDLQPYDVITLNGQALLLGSDASRVSGFTEGYGLLQKLSAPVQVSLVSRTYSPAAGRYTETATGAYPAMRVRWQELYAYEDQMAERYQEGDCTWVLPSSAPVNTNARIAHGAEHFNIMAVRDAYGCRIVHARAA